MLLLMLLLCLESMNNRPHQRNLCQLYCIVTSHPATITIPAIRDAKAYIGHEYVLLLLLILGDDRDVRPSFIVDLISPAHILFLCLDLLVFIAAVNSLLNGLKEGDRMRGIMCSLLS